MIEVKKESFVFTNEENQKSLYKLIQREMFSLYAIDDYGKAKKYFVEGKDFVVDYDCGLIKRTSNSSIPNFANHIFYGKEQFNQEGIEEPKWSNAPFTVYADYVTNDICDVFEGESRFAFPKLLNKINNGESIKITIFGDSISAGCEATPNNAYFDLLKNYLQEKYKVSVEINNLSVPGDSSVDAIKRIKDLDLKCDLAIIAFGMNDQNYNRNANEPFVPPVWYEYNVSHFGYCFQATGAEVLFVSPHLPNPRWIYTSNWLEDYVCALRRLAIKQGAQFADVYETFKMIYSRGKSYESMLRNNINHPNDFGHKVYFETIKKLFVK